MTTATATDPPPARMIHKDQKSKKIQTQKKFAMPKLAIRSLTRSLQSTGKRGIQTWTERQTGIAA